MEKLPEIYLSERDDWRDWLAENNADSSGVWLIYYKKHTGIARIAYEDAVEEALCFGWIDSTVRRLDNQRFAQKFVPRRLRSNWSGHNRRRAENLIAAGLMAAPGMEKIEAARRNGEWDKALEDRMDRPTPPELETVLAADPKAAAEFDRLTPTQRKYFIHWISEAKKPETRERRADKARAMLREGKRPGM
ncbi:MAG: YdeI/OmpD-associated family protein [Candidatus Krumholzibacteriota bacterium]